MKINGLGVTVWALQKTQTVLDAYAVYEATRSESALFDLATKTSELVAGAAVGFLFERTIGALQYTGLDRVFDTLKRDIPHGQYARDQALLREFGSYGGGQASDLLISELRDYVSRNRSFDGLFDLFTGYDVADTANTNFTSARNWQAPRDPLVLDLDGDGIEATAINPNAPILFDHDADNILTATGWIRADDGIVVLDRNGNGLIDSGRELFGDNTLLTTGPNAGDTAANGYQALADVDGNADGVINSADAIYAQLRIWQDANQDGVSQVTELRTLAEVGIASISTVGQATTINLGNGNTQPFSSSFTRTNGTAGTSGTAELSGSLLLAANNFYREFKFQDQFHHEFSVRRLEC